MIEKVIDTTDSFYYSLKEIEWHIMLTLKFRRLGYKGKSKSAAWYRDDYLHSLMFKTKEKIGMSRNDLIYFGTEEYNDSSEFHIHTVVHIKNQINTPIESTRRSLMDSIDPKIVIIPAPVKNSHPSDRLYRHCEIVDSSDRSLRYINKIQQSYDSGKRIFHDKGKNFIQFYNGYMKNKALGTLYPSIPPNAVIGQPRSSKRYFIRPDESQERPDTDWCSETRSVKT